MAIVVKIAAVMIACAGLGLATLAQIPGDLRSHAPNGRPQDGRPKWEAFLEGGASYWNDQPTEINALSLSPMDPPYLFTTYVATRPRIFTGVRYWFNPREAVEVSYSSAQFRMTLFSQFQIGGFEESGQAWGVSDFFAINYVRAFRLWNRVQPFLTVGLGGVHFRSTPLNGLYEPHPITINLGGGFDFQIGTGLCERRTATGC